MKKQSQIDHLTDEQEEALRRKGIENHRLSLEERKRLEEMHLNEKDRDNQ